MNEASLDREPITVNWKKRKFVVGVTRYVDNDNTCIVLLDPVTNHVELKVSVNLHKIPEHQVYVKDYSENRGIAAVMTSNRLLRNTGKAIKNGSVEFGLFDILPKLGKAFGIDTPEVDLPEKIDTSLSQALPGEVANAGPQVKSDEDIGESPSTMAGLEAQQAINKVQATQKAREQIAADAIIDVADKPDPPSPPTAA